MASGAIQSSGKAAMSVEMCVVTPSINVDGTNAINNQRMRTRQASGVEDAVERIAAAGSETASHRTARAHPAVSTANSPYPHAQIRVWAARPTSGSNTNG